MSFLHPLFLLGLAAASIPILIHLFTRRRPRETPFPSLEFLSEVHHSEIRRLRLRQWLLLLLRALAVAALALALARPALRGANAGGRAAATVVALVDVSASMQAAGAGGATLGAIAARALGDLLNTLGPADELLLVPYDRTPHPLTPRPSGDLPRLRAAVRSLAPGSAATDHAAALAFAGRALAESHALNRELFWISDFQASGLEDSAALARSVPAEVWGDARIFLVPVEPRTRANLALTEASLAPADSGAAAALTGAAFGEAPGDVAISVRDAATSVREGASAELGRGYLDLRAAGSSSVLLPLARSPAAGAQARLPGDDYPFDDARWFASGPAATVRVLLRENGPASPLRLALEAGSPASGLAIETVDAASLERRIADAEVVVLHDLERIPPPELQTLLDFWRAGGALLIVLGEHADAPSWSTTLLRALRVGPLGELEHAAPDAAWRLRVVAPGHPAIAGFPARIGDPLSAARFTAVRALAAGTAGRVVLEFDRAHAALIEAPHAAVLNAALDPSGSDFTQSGAFLPLLHQTVRWLGRGTAAASLAPGDVYRAPASTGPWRLEDPAGRELTSRLESSGGTPYLVSAPLAACGLYRVTLGGALRRTFAVNPDPRESDPSALSDAARVRAFPAGHVRVLAPGVDLARRVREARYGRELWRECLITALLLLLAESIIARLGMGMGRATTESPRGPLSRDR